MSRRRSRSSSRLAPLAAVVAGLVAGNQMKQRAIEQAHLSEEWQHLQQIEETKRKRRLLAITELQKLNPKEFEEYIALIFQKMGYETRFRGNTNTSDQGVDIEARRLNEYIIIQCKRYSHAIGSEVVRDFFGTTIHEGADKGILVTTSTFSEPAREWARGKHIELAGPKEILKWLEEFKIGPYEKDLPEPPPFPYPPSPSATAPPVTWRPQPPAKRGFTAWQWLVLLVLSGTACVVACGVCAAIGSLRPPQNQAFVAPLPPTPAPKPSLEGLTFAIVGSKPFDVQDKTIRPAGRFWLLEVAVHNPTDKPVQVTTYNIFLKDRQNQEIWYHHDLTYLRLKNPVVVDLKPGQTAQVALVYDVPNELTGQLSANYNGAVVWFELAR